MRQKGKLYTNYISWLIGSVDTFADIPPALTADRSEICRLCKVNYESRQHLLTDCPRTAPLIDAFTEEIMGFWPGEAEEFKAQNQHERWLWILAGGTLPLPPLPSTYKREPRRTVFEYGARIDIPKDMPLLDRLDVIWDYQRVVDSLQAASV